MNAPIRTWTTGLLSLYCCGIAAEALQNGEPLAIDTAGSECNFCDLSDSSESTLTVNLLELADTDFNHANYKGIDENTSILIDSELLLINQQGDYFDTQLNNLGSDAFSLKSIYGAFGQYKLTFKYQEIPIRKQQNLVTPYTNAGDHQLTLANDWVLVDDSADISITNDLNLFDLRSDWQKLKLDWEQQTDDRIDYQLKYQQIKKTGVREFSSAQIWNISYLPLPIEQQIDQMDAHLSYRGQDWWGSVNYQLSVFNNHLNALEFNHPYLPLVVGSEMSQVALEPDNRAYNLGVNLNYQIAKKTWVKLRASKGLIKQKQAFLPYTTNLNLATSLPTDNLNAEVDTQHLSLRLYSRLTPEFTLRTKYRFHSRDNNSQQFTYQPVIADSFIGDSITNRPYDYRTNKVSLAGDWRFKSGHLISLEYRGDTRQRNFSEIEKNTTQGLEGKITYNYSNGIQFKVVGSKFERGASKSDIVDLLSVEENPLMQRYNQAARDEDKLSLHFIAATWENFTTSFNGDFFNIHYINSEIGLRNHRRRNYHLDFNWHASKNTNLSLYLQSERGEIDMAASQDFSQPNWFANSQDNILSSGFSIQFKKLLDQRLDLVINANHSDADHGISINSGSVDNLPDISNKWTSAKIEINYKHSEKWTFQFKYQLDQLKNTDFTTNDILPGTVSNLITFGASNNDYNVNYFIAGFRYQIF